ncbi:pyridoxal phosphate-dependent aminotransferase family protein [Chitinophaga qingshengii]|uniref:Pyridoxal phosphate-dependent aminotransferase family protein n=1 Tax=Chitinophaga qingshengii TaxID=1569794 RepID=A0ABR7THI9_9BACT|nr:pyridoxal phosphate-dependent aminotransferase family protein [Chitinophaga qingshengii]MBC9929963.1 pyridoxal phosphate-dependent aminotransferase family protein [Chitinophaga qingshengii]
MLLHTDITPGRTVTVDNRSCLFFSGFSYLGLHQQPAFKAAFTEGIHRYGTLFPSSRAGNLRLSLFGEMEHALCNHLGQQAAVVLSSGYMAAQAAVHYAATRGQLRYAPGAHPALWLGSPQLPAGSRLQWEQDTITLVNSHPDHHFVIVTDTLNPITGEIFAFDWLRQLQRKVLVLADDSHGIGILGPEGQGSIHYLPRTDQLHYLITASLAKAYSVEGGVVAGHAADIAALKKNSFFTGSTPMMPAGAYAWLQCGDLVRQQRITLQQNVAYFLHLSAGSRIHNPHALPVFILPQPAEKMPLLNYLAERDVIISSFPYPFPHSQPVNRAIISALHTQQDILTLYQFLKEYGY